MLDLLLPIIARVLADHDVEDDGVALALANAIEDALRIQEDSLFEALVRSVAKHRAEQKLVDSDEALVVAAGQMARKIDAADLYFQELLDEAESKHQRPPSQDNVSLPTFLKFLEAMGMTPAARKAVAAAAPAKGGAGGRIAGFRQREQQSLAGQAS